MTRLIYARVFGDTKGQGCSRDGCGVATKGRHYGEYEPYEVDGGVTVEGFTGWRGPYCSIGCYKAMYAEADPQEIISLESSPGTGIISCQIVFEETA